MWFNVASGFSEALQHHQQDYDLFTNALQWYYWLLQQFSTIQTVSTGIWTL